MENNDLGDVSKTINGLLKGIENHVKAAGGALEQISKFQEVEKKRVKIGKVIATASYMKGGRILIDLSENETEALKYFESLKK
jgi:cell division septal protein FtsQ